jgi:long-chain acyl-CoA synthetase
MNVFEVIRAETAGLRGHPALVDGARRMTYGELVAAVTACAGLLREAGVGPQGRVGLVCGNGADHVVAALAVLSLSAAVVPVAPEHARPEIDRMLADLNVDFVLFRRGDYEAGGAAQVGEGNGLAVPFGLIRRPDAAPPPEGYAAVAPAFIRFSSGTTGEAKGVVLSHATIIERTDAADAGLRITPADRILWVLSMSFHFVVTILLFLRRGATIVFCGDPFPETLARGLREHGGTLIYAAPFHYAMMTGSDLFPAGPLGGVRMAVTTTVKLPADVADSFRHRFGTPLTEAYGIIEVGLPFISPAGGGGIGKPLPGYEARIAEPDADGVGEILLKGPGMLDAYLVPWTPRDRVLDGGWFRTGDLGRLDAEGALTIVGRRKNVINFSGMKVFPAEVEEVINGHPGVRESVVFGEDHPRYGSLPMARIVPRGEGLDVEDLRRFCYERLASYKVPKGFELVDEIPKTKSGKIRRF